MTPDDFEETALPLPAVVAIDVGGTSIKAALVDAAGAVVENRTLPTPVPDGPDAVVGAVVDVARELCEPGTAAVGVVVPGVVEAGVARYSANLGWRDVPLQDVLAAALGRPVRVEHDVRAAGLAERTLGRARDVPDCLVVVIGTGIAALVVSDGAPVRGALGLAGELGHLPVYPDGEPCGCGQVGCAEVYASAAGIARRYRARTGRASNSREIVERLDADPDAAAVWAAAAEALGVALASCTLLLDPSTVVLGGGLSAAGEVLRDPVARALRARLAWRPVPVIELSPLAGNAGRAGAALLAWEAAGRDILRGWPLN